MTANMPTVDVSSFVTNFILVFLFVGSWYAEQVICQPPTRNIALNKPAFQSSFLNNDESSPFGADKAVDGNANSNFWGKSCASTETGQNQWWAVNLLQHKYIDRVVITNRGDCCAYRLSNFYVTLTETSPEDETPVPGDGNICTYIKKAPSTGTTTFQCQNGAAGRYLVIQLASDMEILTLCEVQVFAIPGKGGRMSNDTLDSDDILNDSLDLSGRMSNEAMNSDDALKLTELAEDSTGQDNLTSI